MRRYPEYKKSGVEWIGDIPKQWDAKKIRYFCSMKSGNGFSHDLQGKTGLDIPFFKVADTNTPENKVEMLHVQNTVSSQEVSNFKFILHKPNSIVFPKVGAALLLNKRNILTQRSCIDNNMMSLYSNQSSHKFLYYAMLNVDFKRHYRVGGAVPSINESEIGNIPIAYPSLSEQVQIANFLDRKTEQIDELIRIKERRIKLLQEQRTTLINQAVTKGLDPNVEMKPSGVEWIGEIPRHWEVRKNKRIFNEKDDRSTTGKEELLTVSHITGVSPRAQKNVGMFLAETLEGYKHCSVGNLVINTMWAWMGALGISTFDGIVSPSYNVYQLKSDEYLPRYYDYLYRTPNHVKEIIRWSKGIWHSRWRLYPDAFFSMFTITPPFREQHQIINFLDYKNKQIDKLTAVEGRKIELLKEYRQSLISEAVTGKIDVQNEV